MYKAIITFKGSSSIRSLTISNIHKLDDTGTLTVFYCLNGEKYYIDWIRDKVDNIYMEKV